MTKERKNLLTRVKRSSFAHRSIHSVMLLGQIRRDMYTDYRSNLNTSHMFSSLSTPLSASSTTTRTPTTPHQTMTNYARTPPRYSTVTLLSLRPPSEITIFADHLVERRFLDEENYIDLDRMLKEKAGKFDLDSFNMSDGRIMPSRIHKYDFSDPAVIEKVKSRRPKDPLTPQQVAALTSVATRHQSSTSVFPHQVPTAPVWIDDYSDQQIQANLSRYHSPPQPSMPYQRKNPNQCEIYTNQIKSLLPTYQPVADEKHDDTIPILQRLFEAQRVQQSKPRRIESSQVIHSARQPTSGHYLQGLSAFCTPSTPQKPHSHRFSTAQNEKDALTQLIHEHLKSSTTMQTPATPTFDLLGLHKQPRAQKDEESEQNFYSTPSSPIQQGDNATDSSLENWFGSSINTHAHPRLPADRVLAAGDLEQ